MKKILAVLLTVAMIATMFALSAGAETTTVTPVGSANEGLDPDSFDQKKTTDGQDLKVKVSEIKHKYAVDVTFDLTALTINGTITWDVKDMIYKVEGTASLDNTTKEIKVDNRSDLPVYAYATVTDADANDGITVSTTANSANTATTVAKATAGTGTLTDSTSKTTGTAGTSTITLNINSDNWNDTAAYYAAKTTNSVNQDTFKIATVTVTITKDDTNTAGN